jgi:hypothetical protein
VARVAPIETGPKRRSQVGAPREVPVLGTGDLLRRVAYKMGWHP